MAEANVEYFFVGGQAEMSWNISSLPDGLSLRGTLLGKGEEYTMTNTVVGDVLTMRTASNALVAGKYTFVMSLYKTVSKEIVDESEFEVVFRTPKVIVT